MGQPDEAPSLVGRVKSFDPSKGFGFLSVGQFPQDVYFKSAEPIMVGQEVSFNLHWTQDGKPQARNIGSAMAFGEVCVGFVKRYSAQTGYGFLAIEGGRQDIYFKRTDLPMEYQASMSLDGAQVQFHVKTAADGKPQAEDIMILAAAMPTQGMPTQGMKRSASGPPLLHRGPAANYAAAVPGPDAKRARPNFLPAAFTPGAVAASHAAQQMAQARTAYGGGMPAAYGGGGYQAQPSGGRHAGMVKTFNAQKGFGFIVSPTVPGDVYFQRVGLPPAYQNVDLMGAQVSFMLKYAEDGKPQGNMVLVQG
ncbi:unnamed protein product [Polarella glacialis]|uniref:CSD domain-containing protein n=1 Tax=Polarella glacialis TaxID=89957 RepID=A0A813G3R3_POLGL|nr:unnamed protein product [Polarella glacialis]